VTGEPSARARCARAGSATPRQDNAIAWHARCSSSCVETSIAKGDRMKSQSILLACAGVLITAGGAHAQDVAPLPQPGYSAADPYVPRDSAPVPPAERSAYAWDEPYLASGIGVGLVVGGGVMG